MKKCFFCLFVFFVCFSFLSKIAFYVLSEDGNFAKKHKNDEEHSETKAAKQDIKQEDNDPLSDTSDSQSDIPEADMTQCQAMNKSTSPGSLSQALSKAKSPPLPQQTANQLSYSNLGTSGSKSYSSSCMGSSVGGVNGVNDQIYYPHHSSMSRSSSSSFLPVSSTSPLLQPVSSSLSLHSMNQQMQPACRLPGSSSDCALRQSSHLSSTSSYGLKGSSSQHPSLPSCTYMQSSQPYPSHLTPNVHSMMNMNFSGPMA